MRTFHKFFVADSRYVNNESKINLIITSPPYPMIEMWDDIFKKMNSDINLEKDMEAWSLMNNELNKVYKNCWKILKPGGMLVINMGDAYRKLNGEFKCYPNIAKTIELITSLGFTYLPSIHWFKQVNSPNKFMGAGMYPINTYVTAETEAILVFRKGLRTFSAKEKELRKESAFFWEERNVWFSNIWTDLKGAKQSIDKVARKRSGAFPLLLPLRLISMFSIQGDTVWDPFGGIGTTTLAAMILGRNSYCNDIDITFKEYFLQTLKKMSIDELNQYTIDRISNRKTIENSKYVSKYGPVKTKQEQEIDLLVIKDITFHLQKDFVELYVRHEIVEGKEV